MSNDVFISQKLKSESSNLKSRLSKTSQAKTKLKSGNTFSSKKVNI